MPVTYDSIASQTLSGTQATVSFTSISGNYTDLIAVVTAVTATGNKDITCRVGNNSVDSGTNYSYTALTGDGSTATSFRTTSTNQIFIDSNGYAQANNNYICIVHFMNYANTSTYKTILSRSNNAATGVDAIVNRWGSTSAINQIDFLIYSSGNFGAGTNISLYGIKSS